MKKFLLSLLLVPTLAFAQATPQAANQFWATPSSGTGYLGLRALSYPDLATIKPSGLSAASAPYSGAYLTYCESGSVMFNCSFGNALVSNLPGAFSTVLAGGTSGALDASIIEARQSAPGADVRSMAYNTSTANNSTASIEVATGLTNSYALLTLSNNTGTPSLSLSTGSGVAAMSMPNVPVSLPGGVTPANIIGTPGATDNPILVTNFLAAGQPDGTTDNSAAFQALNNYCSNSRTGVHVMLGPGHFKVHDVTYNCGIFFEGAGYSGGFNTVPVTGTVIDYSAATSFGIKWMPVGFPAITVTSYVSSPGVRNLDMFTTVSGSLTALEFLGAFEPIAEYATITGAPANGILYRGGNGGQFRALHGVFNGIGLHVIGDTTGQNGAGGACALADCSTRVDAPAIGNVSFGATGSGTCYQFTGMVFTPQGGHNICAGGAHAVVTECPAGFPSNAYCPHFFRGFNWQGEFQTDVSFLIQDMLDFKCTNCYAVGSSATTGPAYNVEDVMVNYTGMGGFSWQDGLVYNASSNCVIIGPGITEANISGGTITNCDGGNTSQAGVLFQGGGQLDAHVNGVTFCYQDGIASGTNMAGVTFGAAAAQGDVSGNFFYGCANGVGVNNSTTPASVVYHDNYGPTAPRAPVNSGSCAINTQTGNNLNSSFHANGACAGGTLVFTFDNTGTGIPVNGWACDAHDLTTPANILKQSGVTQTTATFAAATLTNADVVQLRCSPY